MAEDSAADRTTPLGARIYDASLIIGLLRLRDGMRLFFRPILRAHDLTDQNWRIIKVLGEHGAVEITRIGHEAVIPAASASRIVTRMEAAGLLRRRADVADRRRVLVELTPRGRRLFAKVAPLIRDTYGAIAAQLDPALLETLNTAVHALNRQIEASFGDNAPGMEE
jgi:homoprotocatechuate degradation regulator HpaR